MFAGWQTFYQMTGEAAATLTGLLFVIISLVAGREGSVNSNGARLFTSPIVFHLTSVLVISGLALAPCNTPTAPIMLIIVWTLGAFAYATRNLIGILRMSETSHWSDLWFYGVAPFAAYAVLGVADVGALAHWPYAIYIVALSLLALLLLGIRNAWDLATFLAPRRSGPQNGS
jgi:hypothetical protein